MSKIKRNEPCPCGSGKKYKKCCALKPTSNQNVQLVNTELNRLHQAFVSKVMSEYENKMEEVNQNYQLSMLEDPETVDIYKSGINLWMLFNVPCLAKNQTIFDAFYRKNSSTVHPDAKQIFAKWANRVPTVYEIDNIPTEGQFITVRELTTNKLFQIPYHQGEDFSEGNLVIGTLVPLADHHSFVYTIIKLYGHDKARLTELLEHYSEEDLNKNFPKLLADTLVLGMEGSEWKNPVHEQVAQLFANHLIEKDMSDKIIFKGVSLWKEYCSKVNPPLKNIDSYAAALEYYIQKTILGNDTITQGQIAKEYNISPGTVSTNYRKLVAAFEQEE